MTTMTTTAPEQAETPLIDRDQAVADLEQATTEDGVFTPDGKLDTQRLFARNALAAMVDRLDPGGTVTAADAALACYDDDVPSADRRAPLLNPQHRPVGRLMALLDETERAWQPVDTVARAQAVEAEKPRVRASLKRDERVSEDDVTRMAVRAVDRREEERRRELLTAHAEQMQAALAAIDASWDRAFEARRAVQVPEPVLRPEEQPDPSASALLGRTESLMAATVLEQRRTQAMLGELLAVQLVPDATEPAQLLDLIEAGDSPYIQRRAEKLFARRLQRLKAEGRLDQGKRALVDRFLALREARVPEPIRRAEQAEFRLAVALTTEAKRRLSLINMAARTGAVPTTTALFGGDQTARARATAQQLQREANTLWAPIAAAAAAGRGKR